MKSRKWVKQIHQFSFIYLLAFASPPSALEMAIGIHDQGLNNTQFFTLAPASSMVTKLGDPHPGYDIEALDADPITGQLYAAAGDDTSNPGYLYQVDANNGGLSTLGPSGFREVDGLAFRSDGTLWGWAQEVGLFSIGRNSDSLSMHQVALPQEVEFPSIGENSSSILDLSSRQVVLPYAEETEMEDLTWNPSGTTLYAVQNVHSIHVDPDREKDPGQGGVKVWAYYPETDEVELKCEFPNSPEIEALETLSEDTLLFGYHGRGTMVLGQLKVSSCQVQIDREIATPYADVEGLVWPEEAICSIPPYAPAFWNDNWMVRFFNNCYNYGNNKRTNTYAQPGRAAGIFLAWPDDMNCSAVGNAAIADGLVPLPASGTCPDTEDKVALVVAPGWDYHWYRLDNNGMWSHKPGGTPATNLDNAGNPINNPETANRGVYTNFCGYFCTCSDKEQGQGHENIQ